MKPVTFHVSETGSTRTKDLRVVFEVEEVWEVGESNGPATQGTNVFLKEIPMKGSRLHQIDPKYYGN